ncbi:MAG: hypothetical protein ABR529_12630 [Actinomycetota bacterium]
MLDLDDCIDEEPESQGDGKSAGQVEAPRSGSIVALVQSRAGKQRGEDPCRGVDQQHPAPAERLGDDSSENGTGDDPHRTSGAAAAGEVCQTPAQEEQAAEGQRVGVYDPLKTGLRESELVLDHRQGDAHDEAIHDHQEVHRAERRNSQHVAVGAHEYVLASLSVCDTSKRLSRCPRGRNRLAAKVVSMEVEGDGRDA